MVSRRVAYAVTIGSAIVIALIGILIILSVRPLDDFNITVGMLLIGIAIFLLAVTVHFPHKIHPVMAHPHMPQ